MRNVILILSLITIVSCGRSIDYSELTEVEIYRSYMPIFIQPKSDISNNNSIQSVFVYGDTNTGNLVLEITVVFKDEDMPVKLGDFMGDINRRLKHKRSQSLETFYLKFDPEEGSKPLIIYLSNTFSSEQSFDEGISFTAELVSTKFNFVSNRPVFYINTWNHLFSYRDYNPKLSKVTNSDYPIYRGSREIVDNLF